MDDLQRLESWLSPLMHQLQAPQRRAIARDIALLVRRVNARNIQRQVGPEGDKWEKRKTTREVAKPIRYVYRAKGGNVRELEMSSYASERDRITGYDKEAGGLRTMLKVGLLRSLAPQHSANQAAQKRKAQLMLRGLARPQFMRARSSSEEASVYFDGLAGRIASVHHFGLRDKVAPNGPDYDYPARPLLGISGDLETQIETLILRHLTR